jgi:hypothetical protein
MAIGAPVIVLWSIGPSFGDELALDAKRKAMQRFAIRKLHPQHLMTTKVVADDFLRPPRDPHACVTLEAVRSYGLQMYRGRSRGGG